MMILAGIFLLYLCSAASTPVLHSATTIEPWVGSALGTLEYRNELAAIELGKQDYVEALDHVAEHPPKPLLCVSFMGLSPFSCMSLQGNIDLMGDKCDWAIMLYAGTEAEVGAICKTANVSTTTAFCGRTRESILAEKLKKSIPKSVQYQSLLPYLPKYERVILLDEDINLNGFDVAAFMRTWDCSFERRPLIVQPLIVESNQYLSYVNVNAWKNKTSMAGVLASTVGYVEQQVPAFDSIFFTWYVKRVLSQTRDVALQYAIDWGHDRSWCNAANMYARDVLHWPVIGPNGTVATPCALITAPNTAVHHLNYETMQFIRSRLKIVRRHLFIVIQRYIDLFPTWVGVDMMGPYNPLSAKNAEKYQQVRKLDPGFCKDKKHVLP